MQILNVTGLKKVYTTRFGGSQVTALQDHPAEYPGGAG